jgi:iron complex outermembrane receptor protein
VAKFGSLPSPFKMAVLAGSFCVSVCGTQARAQAQIYTFDIPQQSLAASLRDYANASGQQIIFTSDLVAGKGAPSLRGRYSTDEALSILLSGTGLVVERSSAGALMIRQERHALNSPDDAGAIAIKAPPPQDLETVIVTASRITARGFDAPTSALVVSPGFLQRAARPNVFDAITQLPFFDASTGTEANTGNTSTGANGLSSFNFRGLGTIRTLTLLDGQRVVPAYVTGVADVSEFSQLLIQRVDVVTGGASASWGSDAVGGVINFVTDKNFNGVKGVVEGGISTYGDDTSGLVQLAAGTGLFGGRGHVEASGEFFRSDGVPAPNLVGGGLTNGRCCNFNPGTLSYTTTTTPAGVPEITPILNAQINNASEYGLITSGPLTGIAFNSGGAPTQFQYGSPCVANTCVGGDLTDTTLKTTVDDPITRSTFYTRLSYDILPGIELFGTVNIGNVFTTDSPGTGQKAGIMVQCGNAAGGTNAYLPAAINADCVANNITTFTLGVSYDQFGPIRIASLRQQRRYVLGSDGAFNLLGSGWTYNAYAEHGENDTSIHITDVTIPARYNAAMDAVMGPNGTIVCRSAVAQAAGCVPFDPFGGAALSPQALNYLDPQTNGPFSITHERQEAASVSINGIPLRDWAGDVALAFGAEYREEAYATFGDPYGDGVSAGNPNTAAYPADALLNSPEGNNWFAGNFHHGSGNYHVSEAFVETGIPLFSAPEWGKASVDLGARATVYSTSGYVDTWKVGTTWNTPLDGVRLRALQSRDVRAPNLSELFAAPITQNGFVINRLLPASAPTIQYLNETVGNPNLKPETAQTTELGLVFQPDYIAGFSISVDYYRIDLKKQIGALTSQNVVDLCQLYGNASYCGAFNLNGVAGTANPNYVIAQPFNLAETVTDGFDLEASYHFDLQDLDIPGSFVTRGLATHVSKFISDTGVTGQPIAELAGAQINPSGTTGFGGGVPLWKAYLIQTWDDNPYSFSVTERFFSDGVFNPYGIICQSPNCPAPTALSPTYSANKVPGYLYVDVGGSYQINENVLAFFKIDNIGDVLPKPFAVLNSDPVGRGFRIGFRFS